MKNTKFKVGNIVKIKVGIKDPDFGTDMSGWQGQITKIEDDIVCIDWDSLTLSNTPADHIKKCEEDGLDWECIYMSIEDIEIAQRRANDLDLHKKRKALRLEHQWDHLGDKISKHIQNVFKFADIEEESEVIGCWEKYLSEKLSFPFDAEVSEYQNQGPLKQGDKVKVHSVILSDDLYGVIIELRFNRKVFHIPLCDVEPLDKLSYNYELLDSYRGWFANK